MNISLNRTDFLSTGYTTILLIQIIVNKFLNSKMYEIYLQKNEKSIFHFY